MMFSGQTFINAQELILSLALEVFSIALTTAHRDAQYDCVRCE
jgi:hypothetical protein